MLKLTHSVFNKGKLLTQDGTLVASLEDTWLYLVLMKLNLWKSCFTVKRQYN